MKKRKKLKKKLNKPIKKIKKIKTNKKIQKILIKRNQKYIQMIKKLMILMLELIYDYSN